MSLFGGTGFLGLEDSNLERSVENITSKVKDIQQDFVDARLKLPNVLIDLGEKLGSETFSPDSQTAETFKEEAVKFKSRQAGLSIGGIFDRAISFVSNNFLLVGGAVLLFLFSKK